MSPIAITFFVLLGVLLIVKAADCTKKQRALARAAHLDFEESYVVSCLLDVEPTSILGIMIVRNMQDVQDVAMQRLLIKELCDLVLNNPKMMRGVLGEEAYVAVLEFALFHQHRCRSTTSNVFIP